MDENKKEMFEEASRFFMESSKLTEDHGKKLVMDFAMALSGYEDFRQDVKEIVSKNYPAKEKQMIKEFAKVDKAMAALEKYIKGL